MDRTLILYPAFAIVLLALFSYTKSYLILKKYVKTKEIRFGQIKLYSGELPNEYVQSRQHLKNQFELPVIFYLLVSILFSLNNLQYVDIILAWLFVASRYIHSFIRFNSNYVPYRGIVFLLGMVFLTVGWLVILF